MRPTRSDCHRVTGLEPFGPFAVGEVVLRPSEVLTIAPVLNAPINAHQEGLGGVLPHHHSGEGLWVFRTRV